MDRTAWGKSQLPTELYVGEMEKKKKGQMESWLVKNFLEINFVIETARESHKTVKMQNRNSN